MPMVLYCYFDGLKIEGREGSLSKKSLITSKMSFSRCFLLNKYEDVYFKKAREKVLNRCAGFIPTYVKLFYLF